MGTVTMTGVRRYWVRLHATGRATGHNRSERSGGQSRFEIWTASRFSHPSPISLRCLLNAVQLS